MKGEDMERGSDVTASEFEEEVRVRHLSIAAAMAAKYEVEFTLEPTATLDEIRAFCASMQPTIDAKAAFSAKVEKRIFGGRLTRDERARLHRTYPGFPRLRSEQLLATRRRGDAAVIAALREASSGQSVPVVRHVGDSRPRSRRSTTRRAARARAPDDDRPRPSDDDDPIRVCRGTCGRWLFTDLDFYATPSGHRHVCKKCCNDKRLAAYHEGKAVVA